MKATRLGRKAAVVGLLMDCVFGGVGIGNPSQNQGLPAEAKPQLAQQQLAVPRVFHIAGIPGVSRNSRGDLILTNRELIFQKGSKQKVLVPIGRIRKVLFMSGERHYEKTTYAVALASFGPGAFLITMKHKVDTLIIDYTNERGGLMGIVIQTETKDGSKCRDWLSRFGVHVEELQAGSAKQ